MTDEELDHSPMTRSKKYQGLTPSQIGENDAAYLVWCYETMDPKPCSRLLYRDCKQEIADARRPRNRD